MGYSQLYSRFNQNNTTANPNPGAFPASPPENVQPLPHLFPPEWSSELKARVSAWMSSCFNRTRKNNS